MAIKRPDFPLPDLEDPLTAEFFAGAARGELVIPRCAGCDRWVWYPEPACPDMRRPARVAAHQRPGHVVLAGPSCSARSSPRSPR